MKLNKIISFFIPMFLVLFSLLLSWQMDKIVKRYEDSINNDYSIIIVSKYPIMDKKETIVEKFDLKDIKILETNKILKNFRDKLSENTFEMVQKQMPYFYLVYLEKFPTITKLKSIKKDLMSIKGVKKVETFSKNHDKIYTLFLLINIVLKIVFIVIFLFGIISIVNQIKIWHLEESERLSIIVLIGGTIIYGAKKLINSILFASFLSSVISIASIYFLFKNLHIFFIPSVANFIDKFYVKLSYEEMGVVFLISFLISFIITFGVLIRIKQK